MIRNALGLLAGAVLGVAALAIPMRTMASGNDTTFTFNRDIAHIIYEHCTPCHRPGQVAPFVLENYSDVKKRASFIAEVVSKRIMPPWKPVGEKGLFLHSRELDDSVVSQIVSWVRQGAVEGKGSAPAKPKFSSKWELGKPDAILEMSKSFEIPAEGDDVYELFQIPTNFKTTKYIRAVEIRPSDPVVVHHVLSFLDVDKMLVRMFPPGMKLPSGLLPPATFFTGWSPGTTAIAYADSTAKVLPPGTTILLQTHFHPTGKPESEKTSIGLYFTDKKPEHEPFDFTLSLTNINIPPWTNHLIRAKFVTPLDVYVTGIFPHAHYIAKEIKATATPFGMPRIDLIHIDDWDFNWQGQYRYTEPIFLWKGTTIDYSFLYANTEDNPRNPNSPPKRTRYGQRTIDEMGTLTFEVWSDDPDAKVLFEKAILESLQAGDQQ